MTYIPKPTPGGPRLPNRSCMTIVAIMIGALLAGIGIVVTATDSHAATVRWSAWHLCDTAHHNDYQVRMRITPVAGRWSDTAVEVRRAPGHGPSYRYDGVWPLLYDGSRQVSIQERRVSLRNTASLQTYQPSLSQTAANPRGQVTLSNGETWVCDSQIFGI